mmetsp:Transcript_658/g.1357  ORF Transcript_658/g.1357 Transcript_658/m.1357 type:complete len:322 (+) Transcript_658:22-987(+)
MSCRARLQCLVLLICSSVSTALLASPAVRHSAAFKIYSPRRSPSPRLAFYETITPLNPLFWVWGSPVPILLTALMREVEQLEGSGDASPAMPDDPHPRNMLYCFPSFGMALRSPTEPAFFGPSGQPLDRAVRIFFALNVYAGIGWYLFYKFQIENELRERSGEGLGGAIVVLPFAVGLAAGVVGQVLYASLETLDLFSGAFWLAFLWIYVNQWILYEKVNSLYVEAGKPPPLTTWGLLVPGYNFITGIRQIHFLSVLWDEQAGRIPRPDPFCALFPFATKPQLGIVELFTNQELWISQSGRRVLGRWWQEGVLDRLPKDAP